MKRSTIFSSSPDAIDRPIADDPLALLVASGESGLTATPPPLLHACDEAGRAPLPGHVARANPPVEAPAGPAREAGVGLGSMMRAANVHRRALRAA